LTRRENLKRQTLVDVEEDHVSIIITREKVVALLREL
jgi:hypothetical protein